MRVGVMAKVLLAAAIIAAPETVLAQRGRGRGRGRGRTNPPAQQQETPATNPPTGGDPNGTMTFGTEETQNPPTTPTPGGETPPTPPAGGENQQPQSGNGLAGDILGGGIQTIEPERHPFNERISAVQQIYALRNRRLEFQPGVALSLNDPYVSHTGFGPWCELLGYERTRCRSELYLVRWTEWSFGR